MEVGKLADLVVLDGNPLRDIHATANTAMVMVNGRLFDADSMAEIGGNQRSAPRFYWQRHGVAGRTWEQQFGSSAPCHGPKSVSSHVD